MLPACTRALPAAVVLAVAACGGGGGTSPGTTFAEVAGALPAPVLRNDVERGAFADTLAQAFDKTGNGYPDFVMVGNYLLGTFGQTLTTPAKAFITYLENTGGVFVDRTVEVFGTRSIDYSAREILLHDVNGDRVPDILLVTSNEDGRSTANTDHIATPLQLFLSQANGSYQRLEIGLKVWSHDAYIGDFDNDGVLEIIDAGFAVHSEHGVPTNEGVQVYEIAADGTWNVDRDIDDRAIFGAGDLKFADFDGDACLDLVSSAPFPDDGAYIHYMGNCNGTFTQLERYPPGTGGSRIPGETWSGDLTEFAVVEIDGVSVAAVAVDWSESFDIDNDGDPDVLYAITGFAVSDEQIRSGFIVESSGPLFTATYRLRNDGGVLNRIAAPLQGLSQGTTLFWTHRLDLNGDGYTDVVLDEPLLGIEHALYVNRGDGTFARPVLRFDAARDYRYIVPLDYDRDGVPDYISRSLFGQGQPNRLVLLRGNAAPALP